MDCKNVSHFGIGHKNFIEFTKSKEVFKFNLSLNIKFRKFKTTNLYPLHQKAKPTTSKTTHFQISKEPNLGRILTSNRMTRSWLLGPRNQKHPTLWALRLSRFLEKIHLNRYKKAQEIHRKNWGILVKMIKGIKITYLRLRIQKWWRMLLRISHHPLRHPLKRKTKSIKIKLSWVLKDQGCRQVIYRKVMSILLSIMTQGMTKFKVKQRI